MKIQSVINNSLRRVLVMFATLSLVYVSWALFGYQSIVHAEIETAEEWLWDQPVIAFSPGSVGYGSAIVYPASGNYIYAFPGEFSRDFWRYDIVGNAWEGMTAVPSSTLGEGVSLVYPSSGDYIYAFVGNGSTEYWRYSISGNSWASMSNAPDAVSSGASLVYPGSGDYIYALTGNPLATNFWRYSISGNTWTSVADTPNPVFDGSKMVYPGAGDYIYALRGNGTTDYWRYSISGNSWSSRANTPAAVGSGGALVYPGAGDYIYAFRGENSRVYWRYSISSNNWSSRTNTPATVGSGGALVYPGSGDYIYAFRGNWKKDFWRYSISGDSWGSITTAPTSVNSGGSLVYTENGNYIYAFTGGNTSFWRYDVDKDSWNGRSNAPNSIGIGGSLVYPGTGNYIYAFRGNFTSSFWRYNISGNSWSSMANVPTTVGYGGSSVYPGTGNYIYLFPGNFSTSFLRYNITTNSWTSMTNTPDAVAMGSALIYPNSGNFIYAFRGDNTADYWRYDISGNSWSSMANAPGAVSVGGALVYPGSRDYIYAFRGNNTADFWRYSMTGNSWSNMESSPIVVSHGGALVYANGVDTIYSFVGNDSPYFPRYSYNTLFQIMQNPILEVNDSEGRSIEVGGDSGFPASLTNSVSIETNNGQTIASLDLRLIRDRDWSELTVGSDEQTGKAFLHYPGGASNIPGIVGDSYTLYIPKLAEQNSVVICPDISSLENISESCTNKHIFVAGETYNMTFSSGNSDVTVTTTLIEGKEYWQAVGVRGTGGMGLNIFGAIGGLIINPSQIETSEVQEVIVSYKTSQAFVAGDKVQLTWEVGSGLVLANTCSEPTVDADGVGGDDGFGTINGNVYEYEFTDSVLANAELSFCVNVTAYDTPGNYSVVMNDDNAQFAVALIYVGGDNSVFVTADVAPTLSFNIVDFTDTTDTNICEIGDVSTNTPADNNDLVDLDGECGYGLAIGTNAANGFTAYVQANGPMSTGTASIANVGDDEVFTAGTEAYGYAGFEPATTGRDSVTGVIGASIIMDGSFSNENSSQVPESEEVLMSFPGGVEYALGGGATDITKVIHGMTIGSGTPAGYYSQTVTYTVTANF